MHGKGEFAKIKGSIWNIRVETDTVFNVLPRPINNNGLVLVKLKCHLRYQYAYFEPAGLSAIYEALNYLKKKNNKFYKDISVSYGLHSQ